MSQHSQNNNQSLSTDRTALAPLVSVIIRSMDRVTLRQAMDSVAEQTYGHLELVVVNAKGKGHTALPLRHGRIPVRFCENGQPLPRSQAANWGMGQARGDYLLFLDDDDWLLPCHISGLVTHLQHQSNLRAAYSGVECRMEDETGRYESVHLYNQAFDDIQLLYENYIPIHAVLFERELFIEGCKFDEGLDIYEDWDFWLQLRSHGPFGYVYQISAIYRLSTRGNLGNTANQGLILKAWDTIIHKWRNHWSDGELRKIFERAKERRALLTAVEHKTQEQQQLLTALEQERQSTLSHRLAREEVLVEMEQQELRHQETLSALRQRLNDLANRFAHQQHELEKVNAGLAAIENSTIWKASYPYRWLMIRFRALLRGVSPPFAMVAPLPILPNIPCPPNPHPVDVIVPVYRGLAETRTCLESVLATVPASRGEIIVINDASPEPELVAWLEQLATQYPRLHLLHNAENLGFVKTCNRGIALHPERDVILLNSDTETANDWLERLQACAYRDRHIGTVTPFSNNATICSYPRYCADNALPAQWSLARLDTLFKQYNRDQLIDIPSAIGFCMYIRRDCLSEVGNFDERHFGKGYGEENDFSMRAVALGWRNVLSADIFIYHAGSVSFADHQNHRKRQAMTTLNRLYPDYEPLVHQHIAQDPARTFRLRVDLARLKAPDTPILLLVTHDRGGGTKKHVHELTELLGAKARFLLLHATGNSHYLLSWLHADEALQLFFNLPTDNDGLLACLRALAIQRVHFHHTLGLHPLLLELPNRLDIPYDFTIHDYYACCPQINLSNYQNRYCGEPDEKGCNRCLAILPPPRSGNIQSWRQYHQRFITQASRVLAPSQDAALRFARYFPEANIILAPHPDLNPALSPSPQPLPLSPEQPLQIAVLGALSPIKGADILEQCAADAFLRGLPLRFNLLGYAYRDLRQPPHDFLQVYGPYDDANLADLLNAMKPHLVWFPAVWPETYSYTLSTCLRLGLPVVVPDLGAFPERVAGRSWTWIYPWNTPPARWNDFFVSIREQHFVTNHAPPSLLPDKNNLYSSPFNYLYDYLVEDGVKMDKTMTEQERESILAAIATDYAYPRLTPLAQQEAKLRLALLKIVVRLRRAPMLRQIVRMIPLGWQSRVKAWLRGTLVPF